MLYRFSNSLDRRIIVKKLPRKKVRAADRGKGADVARGPDQMPRRATIYDIARLAEVSPGAVSSVLNGTWAKRRISRMTADRVNRIAAEQGYAVNFQASMLRRERSHVIGMIVPKYDNRYFGAIAERFETMARARGLFPVITCTRRDPDLEFEAAREMVSYQAECLVVTGATDPDRIAALCHAAGVRAINLDLPGRLAPSVLSDNFDGALRLTRLLVRRTEADFGAPVPLWFVGGRVGDNNTTERLRGFHAALAEAGRSAEPSHIVTPGYSSAPVAAELGRAAPAAPLGIFANSTIAVEGVMRVVAGLPDPAGVRMACFDWDPFAALLPQMIAMARQDVEGMLARLFALIDGEECPAAARTEIPCILELAPRPSGHPAR